MSNYFITESSMAFLANKYDTYHIEQSKAYDSVKGESVKAVEFIRRVGQDLRFVEAKTSFPNPDNSDNPPERFPEAISDICDKFAHSLSLLSAVKVGIIQDTLPLYLNYTGNVSLKFILVISGGFQMQWCKPIKNAIDNQMPIWVKKIWKPEVFVINQDVAQERIMIKPNE
jgi:hypothetical protein